VLAAGWLACGGNGGGSPTAPNAPAPQAVTVELRDFAFGPRSVTVQPGGTVRWVMRGTDPTHTVTALNGAFDSGPVFTQNGATFTRTFPAAEAGRTFEYRCTAHAACCSMQGSVRVGENAPPPGPGY
jgi:plastocyanin